MAGIKRALIIDDDEVNNFICIKNIKTTSFAEEVNAYLQGEEALSYLAQTLSENPEKLPDVIFLDIAMPDMDGWEFLNRYTPLHAQFPKEVKLFILSASVYRKDIERAEQHNLVSAYVVKPLDTTKLQSIKDKFFPRA